MKTLIIFVASTLLAPINLLAITSCDNPNQWESTLTGTMTCAHTDDGQHTNGLCHFVPDNTSLKDWTGGVYGLTYKDKKQYETKSKTHHWLRIISSKPSAWTTDVITDADPKPNNAFNNIKWNKQPGSITFCVSAKSEHK